MTSRLVSQSPRRTVGIVCGLLAAMTTLPVAAQKETAANLNYPNRVVTLVNPFAPGASTDIVARLIATKLTDLWGKQVVVDNKPGASGAIGLTALARSPADGHMLGMIIISNATNVALQGNKSPIDLVRVEVEKWRRIIQQAGIAPG